MRKIVLITMVFFSLQGYAQHEHHMAAKDSVMNKDSVPDPHAGHQMGSMNKKR